MNSAINFQDELIHAATAAPGGFTARSIKAAAEVLAVANNPSSSGEDSSTYFGYSSAVGDLDADGQRNDVAVSTPRGANLNGTVPRISYCTLKYSKLKKSNRYWG